MTTDEAASLIRALADSIQSDPAQFHFSLTVVGTQASASAPGATGLSVTTTGGGPGAHTVGFQSSATSGHVEIAQAAANEVVSAELTALVATLRDLADAAEVGTAEQRTGLLARLQESAVVPTMAVQLATLALDLAKLAH
jgi:hypothetical protein